MVLDQIIQISDQFAFILFSPKETIYLWSLRRDFIDPQAVKFKKAFLPDQELNIALVVRVLTLNIWTTREL